jgi:hypothetical protein
MAHAVVTALFSPQAWRVLRILAIAAMAAALTAFVLVTRRLAREPLAAGASLPATAPASRPFPFTSNLDCQPCHLEIWNELSQDQHALAWFNEPFLVPDPKRTECNNCHAPQPILEVGIETMPVIRADRFEEGVGCIECHRRGDHVEGPLPTTEAPCNPTFNPAFDRSIICASCHAPHGTMDEWRASSWARDGHTCQTCHMPQVERASATGGVVRKVRSHRMRSQRDPTMLREAVTLDVRPSGGELLVGLTNSGTAHNVPGEIFNREMFVTTVFTDARGEELAAFRESMKTVKREQRSTEPTSQLKVGETRTWRYARPAGPCTVRVRVRYKLFFLAPDDGAVTVHEKVLELR